MYYKFLVAKLKIEPLIVFRIIFGIMMFLSTARFIYKGWITELYVEPTFYFTFLGFDWIQPLGEVGMIILFTLLLLASISIALGWYYRLGTIIFFLTFSYIELIDKTNYLNHYYFISLISLLLIFVPANKYFSLDVFFNRVKKTRFVPAWTINIIKFQLGIVYLFAGISKINSQWLFEAQPLINWLKHQTNLPLIGSLMKYDLTAFIFSWAGMLFDISIFFILTNKRWRIYGYAMVVFFHVVTSLMFPIGVFPFVMIVSTLIFFSAEFHEKIIQFISRKPTNSLTRNNLETKTSKTTLALLTVYITLQILIPFRFLLYNDKLFWTEQGYRFSWRVMLIEKVGYAEFKVVDPKTKKHMIINNSDYLTSQQEKMMATQPDMILQYAHYLKEEFSDYSYSIGDIKHNIKVPEVYANVKVSLFNKGSREFINPETDLAKEKRGISSKKWITPYE